MSYLVVGLGTIALFVGAVIFMKSRRLDTSGAKRVSRDHTPPKDHEEAPGDGKTPIPPELEEYRKKD